MLSFAAPKNCVVISDRNPRFSSLLVTRDSVPMKLHFARRTWTDIRPKSDEFGDRWREQINPRQLQSRHDRPVQVWERIIAIVTEVSKLTLENDREQIGSQTFHL